MAAISCTVNPDGGADYVSLSAAEAGMQATYANLVGDGNTITFNCSGGLDANACVIDGWTTDATHFITVNVAKANRHTSVRGTGYRIVINANNGCCLNIADPYTRVIGVALSNSNADGNYVRGLIASVTCLIDSCLVYDCADNGTGLGIYCNTSSVTYTIVNTIVYNSRANIIIENGTGYIYNCTSLNGQWGIYQGGTVYAKNVYSGGNSSADYQGTITTTTCHSSDGTGNTQTSIANCRFTNSTAGSENIHIDGTSALVGAGTDLHADATYPFSTDFEDDARPDGAWDVGADEYTTGGGGGDQLEVSGFAIIIEDRY